MSKPLLERQVSLLTYLTSCAAIFGNDGTGHMDSAIAGFDPRLLRFEARFSHEKRMEKIAGVFSRTLELLGSDQAHLVKMFAERCPPTSIGRIENARQFCAFLTGVWRFRKPDLAYLPDVAACELAFAEARNWDADSLDATGQGGKRPFPGCLRRHPRVAMQHCVHDVRPLFETDDLRSVPVERETFLAFAMLLAETEVKVFELEPTIFGVLAALSDWTNRSAFGASDEADALIRELVVNGLLETDVEDLHYR
jgi:hypothetical protein